MGDGAAGLHPPGRLLVTGASGFVGGWVRRIVPCVSLDDFGGEVDIRDKAALREAVAAASPDAVLHLAAQSFVPDSMRDPAATYEVNLRGTMNLLDALDATGFSGPLLYVSTGEVYGAVPDAALPVTEALAPAPRNPYAASKLAAEAYCLQHALRSRYGIIVARPFNHIGPGQDRRFAVADFAAQVAAAARAGRSAVVTAGDVDVTRDFTDVRDVVRAYLLLLDQGDSGEIYNVCSGRESSLRGLIEQLAELAGVELRIERDPGRLRPSEQRRMCGDPARLAAATGWEPGFPVRDTLRDLIEFELDKDGS